MAEGGHNEPIADDQPNSLQVPDFYDREQPPQQTGIRPSSNNQIDDSGIDLDLGHLSLTDVSRDKFEEIPTLDDASLAKTLATDQTFINFYSQLDSLSRSTPKAKDNIKMYLHEGGGNMILSEALKMRTEALALKRYSEELLNKFLSCKPGPIVEETGTFDTNETKRQTELVTTKTSFTPVHQPQDGPHVPSATSYHDLLNAAAPANPEEMLPLYDVNQHAPDTLRDLSTRISDSDEELYEGESGPGATSSSLSIFRDPKTIELALVEYLLPLSKCVGIVMTEYFLPEATVGANVDPTRITRTHGTCFRLGSKYVLTNKHVADMVNLAKSECGYCNASVVFNYYHKPPPVPIQFPIEQIKFTCRDLDLDYSVLQLATPSLQFQEMLQNLPGLGHLVQRLERGQKVTLMGHPDGKPMSMDPSCPVESPLINWYEYVDNISKDEFNLLRHPARVPYRSTFSKGSSGSPVFNNMGHLVGIHTQGFPEKGPSQIEQMVRMTAIRAELKLHYPELCHDLFFSQ
ncbi:uncharacterized protein LOC144873459 [Branchiostoma floridae x Branchiostoma japonicum]